MPLYPTAERSAGDTDTISTDALGSALADAGLPVDAVGSLSVFGEADPAPTAPSLGHRRELVAGDGLVHLRARTYDPTTGQFLSVDPLDGVDGTATVANSYQYSNNGPSNYSDPTGLRPDDDAFRPDADAFRDPCWGRHQNDDNGWMGSRPGEEWAEAGILSQVASPKPCFLLPVGRERVSYHGQSISPIERDLCQRDRSTCLVVFNIREIATDKAAQTYRDHPKDGTERHALQHLLGSAMMTASLGLKTANSWLAAHEWGQPSPNGLQNQMDLANNFYGTRLGNTFGPPPQNPKSRGRWRRVVFAQIESAAEEFVKGRKACTLRRPDFDEFVDAGRCGGA